MIARRLVVRGRVQGVFFRNWAVDEARGLGLTGWVRNRDDGGVEALAIGEAAAVERFAAACRRGSPAARVDDVEIENAAVEELKRFDRR